MSQVDLERIREWATAKLSGCNELRGDKHHYIKVVESVDIILLKMKSGTSPWDDSLRMIRLANTLPATSAR